VTLSLRSTDENQEALQISLSVGSAVSAVLTDTLASMTKHSCRAFVDVALSRGTCS
jgi:hypothetical protein